MQRVDGRKYKILLLLILVNWAGYSYFIEIAQVEQPDSVAVATYH